MNNTKMFKWLIVGALITAFVLSPTVAFAAEKGSKESANSQLASAWPMYRHDPQRSGVAEYRGPASEVKVKWETPLSSSAAVTSILVGNNRDIYVSNDYGNLIRLDYVTGSKKEQYNSSLKGNPIFLQNGNVIATDGKQSVVAMQNSELYDWKYTFYDKRDITTSPVIVNEQAVVIHAPDGKLLAINADTGDKIWESEVYGDATPAVGQNGTIYTVATSNANQGEAEYLYAVNHDTGMAEWKLHLSDKNMGQCTVAVGDDGTVYISSKGQDNRLYAVDSRGNLKFKISIDGNATAPAVAKDGTIYVGSQKGILYAFDKDGSKKWQYTTKDSITVAPIIGADGVVYGCAGNLIFALDPNKGNILWQYNTREDITAEPIIDSKGVIYVATSYKITALYSEAPYAPYDLTVSSDRFNNITLIWQQDTAYEEDVFVIEQKTGDQEFTQIGETARNVTTYELKSVSTGQYTFRVRAYNKAGYSQYSNEVTIDLTVKPDDAVKEVRSARFYLGQTIYYKGSSAYMMDVAPVIIEDRTFLPIRYLADALDADVEWLEEEKQINIIRDDLKASLWIGKPWAVVNKEGVFIDPQNQKVSPTIVPPGRTMLPIRFIAESLDCQVEWDEQTKEIKIVFTN